jgi:hypothetical protein
MLKAPRGIWTNPPTSCARKVRRGLLICDDCQALTGGFRAPVGCANRVAASRRTAYIRVSEALANQDPTDVQSAYQQRPT